MAGPGGKWIPPLPHGWEGRYDDNNKAYFFIDHINKKTQWDDPRFHNPLQQAHPMAQATPAAAASSLGLGGGSVQTHGAVAMQDLSPRPHQKSQSQNNRIAVHESNLTNEVDMAIVNKLKAEFPKATKELIIDMLALCHNSERETREQLNDLGFLANSSKGKNSSSHASPHKNTEATPTKKSPDSHKPAPVASAQPAPKKDPLSEGDKKRVLNQAKGHFPKYDPEVIRIALNECHYDLEELKTMLAAWEKRPVSAESAKTTSSRSGSTSAVSSASSVRSFSPTAGSLEPVGFEDTLATKTKGTGNSQAGTHPSGNSASPKRSSGSANVAQSFASSAKGDSSASKICSQHARAKQVTKMSEHLLNTTSDLLNHLATTANCCTSGEDEEERDEEGKKKEQAEGADGDKNEEMRPKQPAAPPAVVTSQPTVEQRSKVTSQYRTEAKGPDASLRKGPDSRLLTSDYTQANGPDKSLCAGPNRSHLIGPQATAGPDMSLRCGPQSSLLGENRNNNIVSTTDMLVNHVK